MQTEETDKKLEETKQYGLRRGITLVISIPSITYNYTLTLVQIHQESTVHTVSPSLLPYV